MIQEQKLSPKIKNKTHLSYKTHKSYTYTRKTRSGGFFVLEKLYPPEPCGAGGVYGCGSKPR